MLLNKSPSQIEVYNDVDDQVVNLFRVLRNPVQRQQLEHGLNFTPFSRTEFTTAYEPADCPVECARRMIVRAQMGFGSAGATQSTTGFRRLGGSNKFYELRLWNNYASRLLPVANRLKNVLIENDSYQHILHYYDSPDTLFYVDPPYLGETRTSNSAAYRFEMTPEQHAELLDQLNEVQGMVVLSGFDSELYQSKLMHWDKVTRSVQASGQVGGVTRTECLWLNPAAQVQDLLGGLAHA